MLVIKEVQEAGFELVDTGAPGAVLHRTSDPGSAALAGFFSSVTVSPTRVSATCLIEAVKKPISPGPSLFRISCLGRKMPTRSIW